MSTRCQIGIYKTEHESIENWDVLLYRHSDGYPESKHGVIEGILPFCQWFNKTRGISDTEYFGARLIQHMCNVYDTAFSLNSYKCLGHGICKEIHGDIEYFYYICPTCILVYAVNDATNWTTWVIKDRIEI